MKKIQYIFVGKGSIVSKNSEDEHLKPKKNRIFLDVGNSLDFKKGIIDNHQFDSTKYDKVKEANSTASYCFANTSEIKEYISNIKEQNVEIVIHKEPDIDCFVSAYIVEKYVNNENLPIDTEILIKCAEEIDSGILAFESDKPLNPCFIVYAIAEVVKEDIKKLNEENKASIDEQCMKKGVQLIDLILKELGSKPINNKKSLDNVDLSNITDLFNREMKILNEDYNNYINDYKDPEICEKGKMKLLLKNSCENELKEVDALFWIKVPNCVLHKYWARQDFRAPLGKGYVFTFIPSAINEDASTRQDDKDDSFDKISIKGIKTNKAIISVDPKRDVCLKGLGESLEIAEREAEKNYFGKNVNKWRSRIKSRFAESWCDNDDPWYDGRHFDYTIVDAPREGSLMSIKEIRHIVNNFTAPIVDESLIRFVIPFDFNEKDYKKLCEKIDKTTNIKTGEEDIKDYFNSYIQTYLFEKFSTENIRDNCSKYVTNYSIHSNKNIFSKEQINLIKILDNNLNIIVFKYGVGFIYFDIKICKKNGYMHFDEIININSLINNSKNYELIFNDILKKVDINSYGIEKKKIMIYSGMSIKSNMLYEKKHKEMIYKLMNFMKWQDVNNNAIYMENLIDNDIIKSNENTYYGFNKNGAAMLIINDNYECIGEITCNECTTSKCINKNNHKAINELFGQQKFYVFILALQQKLSLFYFINRLSIYDKKRKKKDIQRLRSQLLNFTTQAWFTEITEDKVGTEFYKKWTAVFENKELYSDIYQQLSAVDDYYKSKMSSKFTLISAITFPILIIGSIGSLYSTGYIKNSGNALGFKWIHSTESMVGALNIGWGWFILFCFTIVIIIGTRFLKDE